MPPLSAADPCGKMAAPQARRGFFLVSMTLTRPCLCTGPSEAETNSSLRRLEWRMAPLSTQGACLNANPHPSASMPTVALLITGTARRAMRAKVGASDHSSSNSSSSSSSFRKHMKPNKFGDTHRFQWEFPRYRVPFCDAPTCAGINTKHRTYPCMPHHNPPTHPKRVQKKAVMSSTLMKRSRNKCRVLRGRPRTIVVRTHLHEPPHLRTHTK